MGNLINQLREPELHYPGNFNTVHRANAILMCMCQDAADALEAQAKEVENAKSLWKIAHDERSEAMLELLKYKSLCNQMGEALERCTKYTDADYDALSAWRATK